MSANAGGVPFVDLVARHREAADAVEAVLDCTDTMARDLDRAGRDAMQRHFVTTSRYEWMFWDMGYRQESWPV